MLISMSQALKIAKDNKFAIPAFNAGTGLLLKSVVEEAIESESPIILALHPNELKFLRDSFVSSMLYEAKHTSVPIVIHLDHGSSIEQIKHAIDIGFNSVMIDGSHLGFDDNIELTREAVEYAKKYNVCVEGELGTIGTADNSIEGGNDIIYTRPEDARVFVEKTGVDSLAIAIGTAHGIYPKGFVPKLKLDLLDEITKVVDIPLVLHGGSSNTDSEIKKTVELGITKINISSDIKISFMNGVKKYFDTVGVEREPSVIYPSCIEDCKHTIRDKMKLFNSINKSSLYR